jgi:hypothetical protein
MKKWGWVMFIIMMMLACSNVNRTLQPAGIAEVQPLTPESTKSPEPIEPITSQLTIDEPSLLIIPSAEASAYNGQWVIVRIEHAYCSYHPDIDGQPTFCNDQPYPDHNFTLLVWEQDWGYLDGLCLLVQGQIELYQGKAEIIAEGPDQVSECE